MRLGQKYFSQKNPNNNVEFYLKFHICSDFLIIVLLNLFHNEKFVQKA